MPAENVGNSVEAWFDACSEVIAPGAPYAYRRTAVVARETGSAVALRTGDLLIGRHLRDGIRDLGEAAPAGRPLTEDGVRAAFTLTHEFAHFLAWRRPLGGRWDPRTAPYLGLMTEGIAEWVAQSFTPVVGKVYGLRAGQLDRGMIDRPPPAYPREFGAVRELVAAITSNDRFGTTMRQLAQTRPDSLATRVGRLTIAASRVEVPSDRQAQVARTVGTQVTSELFGGVRTSSDWTTDYLEGRADARVAVENGFVRVRSEAGRVRGSAVRSGRAHAAARRGSSGHER